MGIETKPPLDIRPGDVVWVRMVAEDQNGPEGWWLVDQHGQQRQYASASRIVHVEPRPPEPLKVGDRVKAKFAPATGTILGINVPTAEAWIDWGAARGVMRLDELERAGG